jgi:hypothetical protein
MRAYTVSTDPKLVEPVLETVLQTRLPDGIKLPKDQLLIWLDEDDEGVGVSLEGSWPTEVLFALAQAFSHSLVVKYPKKELVHEFKILFYHRFLKFKFVDVEVDEQRNAHPVHPAVLLPMFFGPGRRGLSWARVAAGTALYDCDYDCEVCRLFDFDATLCVLEELTSRFDKRLEEAVDKGGEYVAHELAMMYARPQRPLCDWLLQPYLGDLGKAVKELRSCDSAVLAATESFSAYYLYLLQGVERVYVIYTPNVYHFVKYALSVKREEKPDVVRILASSYNPHINYHIFKKLIEDGACYHPKHTGPAPIYLALKKLEREGKLKKVS